MNRSTLDGPRGWQLVFDCADPHRQVVFWSAALGYEIEDNSVLIERLLAAGTIAPQDVVSYEGRPYFRDLAAIRHPGAEFDPVSGAGRGRRVLFQRVPEAKTVKNRLHIDINAGPDRRDAEVRRLRGLGAVVIRTVEIPGSHHVTMADPEGNEFDVQ